MTLQLYLATKALFTIIQALYVSGYCVFIYIFHIFCHSAVFMCLGLGWEWSGQREAVVHM